MCSCYRSITGDPEYHGPDCSQRACPRAPAWLGEAADGDGLHPLAECANKGICDRKRGLCQCFPGYDGIACQRAACPQDCNDRGVCYPQRLLAAKAGVNYTEPWDATKSVGCLCDSGFRGPSCADTECPSGPDPLAGFGNEAGRDCSGRGLCDYGSGLCRCFEGFIGERCEALFQNAV